MFEGLSDSQIWMLIAGVAVVAFMAGRRSAKVSPESFELRLKAEQEAAQNFSRLSGAMQREVDRLLADGKMIEAIKLIRAELNTGLYEAKQVVDQRKRSMSPG